MSKQSLTKELKDFYRFFWKTPKKDIVFYAEHEGYFPNFEGIIEELTKKYSQEICYVTSSLKDPILHSSNENINTFYINKLLPYFMKVVNCKIFLLTMTDLHQFHIKRSVLPVHYIYVFHAFVSTHMMYRKGAFDYYDSVLCVGPHQIKEIRKNEKLNKLLVKSLVKGGYYRIERIHDAYNKFPKEDNSNKKKIILIAPSWGEKNILESCGENLVEKLLSDGYKVIVRPHPETVKRSPDLIAAFDKFNKNENFTLELSVETDESLLKADLLICDCSGIMFEYALGTKRPVLFIDVPKKIKNKDYHELGIEPLELAIREKMGVILDPEKLENVSGIISELIEKRETYRDILKELREQNIYAFGQSSEIGAQYVMYKLNRIKHEQDKS